MQMVNFVVDTPSSNADEVIRAVLNFFFFLQKDFASTKTATSTKTQISK